MPDDATPDPTPRRSPGDLRRIARREAAAARWARPLTTPWLRLRAWANMLFVDHGVLRAIYLNRHRVSDRAWRAAQPMPGQIAAFARAGGRAVVSLRGGVVFGSWPLEQEACARHGLALHRLVLRSRGLPTRAELAEIDRFVATVETPVMFHCKSGADRAGLMSALCLILAEGRSVAEAAGQLSLRYGHLSIGPTGVLDLFIDRARAAEARGLAFRDWVATEYDPDALLAEYRGARGRRLGALLTDTLLRRE